LNFEISTIFAQIGHNWACTNARAAEFAPNGVFGDGRFNGAIQIFFGSTLVAMVTKIRPFSTQICHNSACTNAKAAEFAARVFGDSRINGAIQIFRGRPLLPWERKLGYFRTKSFITRLLF